MRKRRPGINLDVFRRHLCKDESRQADDAILDWNKLGNRRFSDENTNKPAGDWVSSIKAAADALDDLMTRNKVDQQLNRRLIRIEMLINAEIDRELESLTEQ